MAALAGGIAGAPKLQTPLLLSLRARSLRDTDWVGTCDPFAIISVKSGTDWVELGRTGTIQDSESPQWSEQFTMEYFFEQLQELQIAVYDRDSKSEQLTDHQRLGAVTLRLGDLVSARGMEIERPLDNSAANGFLTIGADYTSAENQGTVFLEIEAKNLAKMDFFGSSDPYLQISRLRGDGGQLVPVFRTEFYDNQKNVTWKPIKISMQALCNNDEMNPLEFAVFDHDDGDDADDLIGSVQISLKELLMGASSGAQTMVLELPKKKRKKRGEIVFRSVYVREDPTFVQYLQGGLEINLMVAIDFTASNGAPSQPNSLHFLGGTGDNDYARAIRSVGSVLESYDADHLVPTWGFGAFVDNATRHAFVLPPLGGKPAKGVEGILSAYRDCLGSLSLSGPTYMQQILAAACMETRGMLPFPAGKQKYGVLLILTDGAICDVDATVAQVVEASSLPLSVIIVGVGGADFSTMEFLDSDKGPLRTRTGATAKRDIVQFVPFREVQGNAAELARRTLAEVPQQVLQYMEQNSHAPLPKRDASGPPAY